MFRRIRGQSVNTVSFGSGDTALVAVSGAFGTWEVWQQPFELLSRRWRTIGYDHFGVGETRVPPELVTFENQVLLLEGVLDTFGIERCVLAGDSNNTAVALEAARRWPGRVNALVLVSGAVDFVPSEDVVRFVKGLRSVLDATLDFFVELCLPEDDAGHLRAWLRDIIARTGGERAAQLIESFYEVDVRSTLSKIKAPTLVLHGALDALPTSTPAAAEEMAATIPDAELKVLPDAGHVPTLSRPQAVVEAIEGFVRSRG